RDEFCVSSESDESRSYRGDMDDGTDQRGGRLLAVNVGMPKDVPWQGKTVFTGVYKDAVTGPRRVRKLNVDGDGQGDLGGHGGDVSAVFVYPSDADRYCENER